MVLVLVVLALLDSFPSVLVLIRAHLALRVLTRLPVVELALLAVLVLSPIKVVQLLARLARPVLSVTLNITPLFNAFLANQTTTVKPVLVLAFPVLMVQATIKLVLPSALLATARLNVVATIKNF